jgi:hypothetical protein
MCMILLDSLDRQLISLLRADGRAPVSQLATVLKVSRATVQTRLTACSNPARSWASRFARRSDGVVTGCAQSP